MDTVDNRNEIYEKLEYILSILSDFYDDVHDTMITIKPMLYDKSQYLPVQVGIQTYIDSLEGMSDVLSDCYKNFSELSE